jgi:hypothetical protein
MVIFTDQIIPMKSSKLVLFFTTISLTCLAQEIPPKGYFTSEAVGVASGDQIIVSIKKYNPSADEINNAVNPPKNAPLSYLQIPVIATHLALFNKGFESKLYCLNRSGNIIWEKTLGYSKNSDPSPVTEEKGFIYSGEGSQEKGKVVIRKFDKSGKEIWKNTLDSLENVNAIALYENKVNILASFDHSEKIETKKGEFSFKTYPIYFFIQLNPESGAVIKKEYQMMGNYLSSIGFGYPTINSDQSYYLSNSDSAIFLSVANQKGATIVSEGMSRNNKILALTASPESNHYITELSKERNKNVYTVITDFYGKTKKYQSELPIPFNAGQASRYFIHLTTGDSILSVISNLDETNICYTNPEGQSQLYKKSANPAMFITGSLLMGSKPVLIALEGRNKPGIAGTVKLLYY